MPAWFGSAADSPADKDHWLQAWGLSRDLVSVSYLQRAIFGVMRDMGLDVAMEYNEGLFSVDLALFLQPTRPGGERRKVRWCESAQLNHGGGCFSIFAGNDRVVACPVSVEIVLLPSAISSSSPGSLQLWLTPWALSRKSKALSWPWVSGCQRGLQVGQCDTPCNGPGLRAQLPAIVVRSVIITIIYQAVCECACTGACRWLLRPMACSTTPATKSW